MKYDIVLPSKPKSIKEEDNTGIFQIDGLNPGYGHTLGSSLRRIILSSLPGAAITTIKIDGVQHEFSTIDGIKEDVITILLHLKKVRLKADIDEPLSFKTSLKGDGKYSAGDLETPSQLEILNPDQHILEITKKSTKLDLEITVEKGMGYVSREHIVKGKTEIGLLALDALFSPIRRVNYEVENMRVGERTDYNRLRIFIETDGTISPREVLEQSVEIMIGQLKAIMGVEDPFKVIEEEKLLDQRVHETLEEEKAQEEKEVLKTRIESLNFSTRTENALINSDIRTLGGLIAKSEAELVNLEGVGDKAIEEIREALEKYNLQLES